MTKNRLPILYRFLIYFVLFAMLLTGSLYILQRTLLPSFYYNQTVVNIKDDIKALDDLLYDDDIDYVFETLVSNYQRSIVSEITIYSPAGSVLYNDHASPLTPVTLKRLETSDIEETSFDGRMTYLVVFVKTEDYIFRFKTPYESLGAALSIINELFVLTLGFALLISMGLAYVFSRNVSRPLVRLDRIASKMARLDFSVHFEDKRTDEIGNLGRTLNHLSHELKETITMLETELAKEKHLVEMRKTFVSNVSHEMQTPLAVILGTLEAIEDGLYEHADDRTLHIKKIGEATTKMSRLVFDMLDLAQLESGSFHIDEQRFDYLEVLENVTATFKALKNDSGITLKLQFNTGQAMITGDAGRIEQVLNNLLSNAYNHAYQDTTITITVYQDEDRLVTEVHNEGPKIPEEMLEEIFMSFHKGKSKQTGTGLGLAIARQIITLHGGDLKARNTDSGVTFFFTLYRDDH
ncbi:MAG: HAMP domain-containing histidine kinase [Acholeplasmataceae bacterium]|nr:HAMP domain-containing histidine kinase [Acholeplasmataceae bacterium]